MITLQTADNALKNMYLGVLSEQLNLNANPLLTLIDKNSENVVGKEVHRVITNGFNGGIGAGTEAGSLPVSNGAQYTLLKSGLKNLYGKIEISDKAIRASASSEGAFVNLIDAEMQGLLSAGKFHMGRMLYGTGNGYLAELSGWEEGSAVFEVDTFKNLMVGMRVDLYVDGEKSNEYSNLTIVDWDIPNSTVTLSKACGEDLDLVDTVEMYAYGSGNGELTGLGAIIDTTNFTSLYGVDRTNVAWLKPTKLTASSSSFGEEKMLEMVDTLATNWNANVDFIAMSYALRRKYQTVISTNRVNTDILTLAGGYTALSFNGIPVVADRFIDENDSFFIDSTTLKLHQLCDWEWLTNDKGQILRQKEGYPIHTATLVKYAELICDKPAGLGYVQYY